VAAAGVSYSSYQDVPNQKMLQLQYATGLIRLLVDWTGLDWSGVERELLLLLRKYSIV